MNKIEKENLKGMVLMDQEKCQKYLNEACVDTTGKISWPEYWKKRRHTLSKNLLKMLQDTANREPELTDDYGSYKAGTFLHRAYIVTVTRELGLWQLHIVSDKAPITLPIIEEVRYRYIPNHCVMCQFYPSREESGKTMGVVLVEMPGSTESDDDGEKEAEE